jgi:hypothetical protein
MTPADLRALVRRQNGLSVASEPVLERAEPT